MPVAFRWSRVRHFFPRGPVRRAQTSSRTVTFVGIASMRRRVLVGQPVGTTRSRSPAPTRRYARSEQGVVAVESAPAVVAGRPSSSQLAGQVTRVLPQDGRIPLGCSSHLRSYRTVFGSKAQSNARSGRPKGHCSQNPWRTICPLMDRRRSLDASAIVRADAHLHVAVLATSSTAPTRTQISPTRLQALM